MLETQGPPLHGQGVPPEVLGRVMASLAAGLGSRAAARVFEVAPNTVRAWLGAAADPLQAFASSFLHDVQASQLQRDALWAGLRAVKGGELREAEAIDWGSSAPPPELRSRSIRCASGA